MSLAPKISFGFSKSIKKTGPGITPVINNDNKEDKQYIQCVEDSTIKVIGGEAQEKAPLIIPMKNKTTTSAAILARIAKEVEPDLEEDFKEKPSPDAEPPISQVSLPVDDSLESKAIRELMQDASKKPEAVIASNLVVPVSKLPGIEGESESTMEDYENIPISDFGLAMLRGMGWKEDPNSKKKKNMEPSLPRPKGMGLGADKVAIAHKTAQNGSANSENLKLCKGAFVKLIAGKNVGSYGQVIGFDDENRVMVKAAIGEASFNLNELMLQLVSKDEYKKQSKVLNAAKYEEFKQKELKKEDRSRSKEKKYSEDKSFKKYRDDSQEKHKYKSENRRRSRSSSPSRNSKYDRRNSPKREHKRKNRSRSRDREYRRHSRSRSRDRKSEKHRHNKYR